MQWRDAAAADMIRAMASAKGKFVRLLAGFALERASVASVDRIGGFVRLRLRWTGKPFAAGTKVQLLLPSDDMRTYSPIRTPDGIDLLGWTHGDGPGSRWLQTATVGDEIRFVGPQRSLVLEPGPAVIVGDETSVAVAAALAADQSGHVQVVIQSDAAAEVREAAASVGLREPVVVARGDTDATLAAIATRPSIANGAVVGLTGGSELVVRVREGLRRAGTRNIKTKTYWIPGKTGLD